MFKKIEVDVVEDVKPGFVSYIACCHDVLLWIGLVNGINKDEEDFEVKFTHWHGLSQNFK